MVVLLGEGKEAIYFDKARSMNARSPYVCYRGSFRGDHCGTYGGCGAQCDQGIKLGRDEGIERSWNLRTRDMAGHPR